MVLKYFTDYNLHKLHKLWQNEMKNLRRLRPTWSSSSKVCNKALTVQVLHLARYQHMLKSLTCQLLLEGKFEIMKNLALRQLHRTSVYTTCAACVVYFTLDLWSLQKDADIFHSFWRDCQLSSKSVACAETCVLLSLPRRLRLKSTSTQEFYSTSNFFFDQLIGQIVWPKLICVGTFRT